MKYSYVTSKIGSGRKPTPVSYTHLTSVEKALVYLFADSVSVDINNSKWLRNYLSDVDLSVVDKVKFITNKKLSLNELIAIFEMLVPQSEKKEKGVVYTPEIITRYIVSNTLNGDSIPTVLDPSCGCLLYTSRCV